jgi:spermidine/putrescine transport system substrate-binding protein
MKKRRRRVLGIVLAGILAMGMLTGCGTSSENSAKGEVEQLNICIWDGNFSEDAIHQFEEDNNCTVNITYIENTDTMISKLLEGGNEYDVCDIEAAYIKSFVDNGLLQELDHSTLTNEAYVDQTLMESGPTGDEDFVYTTPDMDAGYTAIIYNTKTCPIEIKSFQDLTNPALKGEIAMVNSTISLYGAALSALGYSPDSTSEDEISQANDLLSEIKQNVKTFVGESAVSALVNGECSVALCWDYATLCFDNQEYWEKFAIADIDSDYEKFIQYWGITATSKKTELANKFINYMISPKAVAMHVEEWGQIPMVQREYIEEYLPEDFYENPCISKYDELSNKSWMVAVNDEQINLMDTYYTLLMGGN